MCRAIFLDRDGTINEDFGYVYLPANLRLVDNAIEGLQRLHALNFALVVITNQSGIARGYYSESDMHAFHVHLSEILAKQGVLIRAFYYSPYLPDATVAAYRRNSPCRKPGPGMILKAGADFGFDLSKSYLIGDKRSDIGAGVAAGCRTILVRTGYAGQDQCIGAQPDWIADDLLDAAKIIQNQLR